MILTFPAMDRFRDRTTEQHQESVAIGPQGSLCPA